MSVQPTDIQAALTALPDLPVNVDSWHVETGTDWTDDDAIWIWGIVEDAFIDTGTQFALRKAIRSLVQQHAGDEVRIFIRFREASELAQVQ